MSFILHSCLSILEFALMLLSLIGNAAVQIIKYLFIALWALVRISFKVLKNLLYYTARAMTFPFRMCFPKEDLNAMDGVDFENFCSKWLRKEGYKKIRTTPISGDYGIDLLAEKGGVTYGIQCKRWKDTVGIGAVQEACAGIAYYSCDKAMVITNSEFSQAAENLAEANGVDMIDGETLNNSHSAELLTRTRLSLQLAKINMWVILVLACAALVYVLLDAPKFALFPLLLIIIALISLHNVNGELSRRKEELIEEAEQLHEADSISEDDLPF